MKESQFFFLLLLALSTIVAIGNCQIDSALGILRNAGRIKYTITINYNPQDLSAEHTVLQLKKINEESNINKVQKSDHAQIVMEEVVLALGGKRNIRENVKFMTEHVDLIDSLYYKFNNFVESINTTTDITVIDEYFQGILHFSGVIENALEQIRISSTENAIDSSSDLFLLIDRHVQEYDGDTCAERKLTQGHVWNFFNIVFDTEYKGSFLLIMAYRHLTRRKIANHRHDIEEAQNNAKLRMTGYFQRAHKIMKYAPKEILRCDDGIYVKNTTYVELQGISQGFIIDPVSIKNSQNCYILGPQDDICERDNTLCFHRQCSQLGGKVNQCRDLTEGRNIKKLSICPAEDHEKRYSWLQLDDAFIGNHSSKQSCSKPLTNYGMVGTESHGFLFFSWSKEIEKKMCFCNCERPKWKRGDVRAISLLWTEVDHANNRVVTDIKFQEKNGIIQISVQQGRILPGGRIDQSSLSWIDTPNAVPSNSNNNEAPLYKFRDREQNSKVLIPGFDFEYISRNLSMNLDDVIAPKNHVVIAVGFQKTRAGVPFTNGIELMIATVEFNFSSGALGTNTNYQAGSTVDPKILNLGSPGNPTNMKMLNNEISKPKYSVRFQQTDWKKDLGQSIVPFFDIRPLKPKIALPLSGVGLYHRGCKDCGGFLSWKLILYDLYKNLRDQARSVILSREE